MTTRGQSSVLGSLLMVAVVVILLATVALAGFAFTDIFGAKPPDVAVETTVDGDSVTLRHHSGDSMDIDETELVLDVPSTTMTVSLSTMDSVSTDGDDRFSAGEVYAYPHGVTDGEVTARLVHRPSNAVVDTKTRTITDGTVLATDWDGVTLSGYSGSQDGSGNAATTDGGRSLLLSGNRWLRIDYDYTVTEDTMLTFEFRSSAQGDIHGIGLDDDTSQSQDRVLRVYGTQNWGINVTQTGAAYYDGSGDWRRYTVPIGELYADRNNLGDTSNLVVVMDCDTTSATASGTPDQRCLSQDEDGNPTAISEFRTVRVYEGD